MSEVFDAREIEKFGQELLDLAQEFPNEAKKFIRGEADELRKRMVTRAKACLDEDTGNYIKGFKKGRKIYDWHDSEFNIRVYNKAPHAHLIEYGHKVIGHKPNKTDRGKITRPFHIVANTAVAFQSQYEEDILNKLAQSLKEALEK